MLVLARDVMRHPSHTFPSEGGHVESSGPRPAPGTRRFARYAATLFARRMKSLRHVLGLKLTSRWTWSASIAPFKMRTLVFSQALLTALFTS